MALQRTLCYCRDTKSSSTMDTMLRVVADTMSNNLAIIGNISFHSVKPLFNFRERLRFKDSVAKIPFSTQVVLLVSLKSSLITTHVSSKDLLQMLSFLPYPRRLSKSRMYRLLMVCFSKPLPLISIGAPPPPSSQLLIFMFLNRTKHKESETKLFD